MNQTQSSARENFIFDAISEMARLTTPVQIADALGRTAGKLGFDSLGITALPPLSRGADPLVLAEQAPEGFREFYTRERLYLADHIAAHARVAVRPFCYSEAPYDSKESAKHRRFMQALNHYGLGEGIVVPVGHQRHQPACVWLSGTGPELHDDAKRAIQLISLFAAARAYAFDSQEVSRSALSPRESEALTWTARGKSAWEIGEILNISKRTADAHVQAATAKLGAANKTQAVVNAILWRMIEV